MKKSTYGIIWQKEAMFHQSELPGLRQSSHNGEGVDWTNAPLEKPLSRRLSEPLLLNKLQHHTLDLYTLVDSHFGPSGHKVGVDEAFVLEEGHRHRFAPVLMNLGLVRPRQALPQPLCQLLLVSRVWKDTPDSSMVKS